MANKTYRVYISSTHDDLHDFRDAVVDSVVKLGMLPIARDEIGLANDASAEFLHSQMGNAQVFIGIYAHQYGSISSAWDKSLIEMEYEIARENKLKSLFFFVDPGAMWQGNLIDRGEGAERLAKFKNRIHHEAVYNTFSTKDDLQVKVMSGLHQIIEQMHRDDGTMTVQSVFGVPLKNDQFKSDVFMIMPFREKFMAVYGDHIKPTMERGGLKIIRGDDFFSENAIVDEIWAAIYHSKIVVAECTDRNPNVYYELGIAHAIGKPSILIVQDIEDIPFDLRHLRIIVYQPTPESLKDLEIQLEKACQGLLNDLHQRN
ncbi:MAG: DUF4062 domain-containing protein [Aggregatilineales bacterium]